MKTFLFITLIIVLDALVPAACRSEQSRYQRWEQQVADSDSVECATQVQDNSGTGDE